ncbi:ABC transporter ATP-binding protein [Furfurilactobacillus curtus]|uniref:Taurine ABC transporter ATP-binding protein n=1 Tax=Furfurilactobacillus curtus TaxID=1746200 RepID=A0ABQ5JLM1_9LACO
MKNDVLLTVERVSKTFVQREQAAEKTVLNNICLQVSGHQFVSILGHSGVGKSTLLRMIAGLMQPTSGVVTFEHQLVTEPSRRMSMVFQNFALFPWLTVRKNISFGLEGQPGLSRQAINDRVTQLIELIGLVGLDDVYPHELSGGMKQRVGFARALAVNPDLLLLDEPFSALDVLIGQQLSQDFIRLWEQNLLQTQSIIMVTHNIEEAVRLSDVVYVLGGTPGEVVRVYYLNQPRNERTMQQIMQKTIEITNQFKHDMQSE